MITERIDAVTLIPLEYKTPTPPAPRSVKVEISPRCNLRCGFCALRTREKQPREDMDPKLFRKVARELKAAGVEELGLFYLGESFMAPDLLVDAIKFAKQECGFGYVFLTSNASLADPASVNLCMKAGLDSLKWSVNAATAEQYAEIMGVKPKVMDAALHNIKAAHRIRMAGGYRTKLYASSILYEGEQHERMQTLLDEHVLPYVDQHYWLPLYSMGSMATQREAELGYRPTAGNQGRIGALREPLPCWSVHTEGHIRADGGVSACCFDASGDWIMGNVAEQSFMEAWHSEAFQRLRAAHLKRDVTGTICENCVAYA